MAEIAKSGNPSLASLLLSANHKITGLYCGEDIAVGDCCYIKSDGKIWRCDGSAVGAATAFKGIAATAGHVAQGDAITLISGCNVQYGTGLTPGAEYYLSGTVVGGIANAASTGGVVAVGFAVDTTRIHFYGPSVPKLS